MLVEDQRFIHEDLERLEQGISDRVTEEPRNVRLLRLWSRFTYILTDFTRFGTA